MTPLQKAAQAAIDHADEFYALYKRTVKSGCLPFDELKFVAAQKELRKALDDEIAQAVDPVAIFKADSDGDYVDLIPHHGQALEAEAPLYLHPPQPQATTPVPEGYVQVSEETLLSIKGRVNTLATLSLKADRYSVGIAIKQTIADILAAQGEKP